METLHSIRREVESRKLYGVMNDTRWQSVYDAFQSQDLPFEYRSVDIFDEIFPADHLRFDISEVLPRHFAALRWLEIHTKEIRSFGKLVPPLVTDHTSLAIELAVKAKARFTLTDYGVRIWGYIKQGEVVEFYQQPEKN
ncbi:DUF6678 family protein [Endozoicomonadaceae bacterium StTr2]